MADAMSTDAPLAGRAVLVTGPAKGLGLAVTRAIATAGGDLVLVGRDLGAIGPVAEEMLDLGRRVLVVATEVAREADVRDASTRSMTSASSSTSMCSEPFSSSDTCCPG